MHNICFPKRIDNDAKKKKGLNLFTNADEINEKDDCTYGH